MPGVNVTNGGWDSVVSLARSGAADTHVRSKDGGQTLYANRTKLSFSGHKNQIDPETVNERRVAAAQAVHAQFKAKFNAQYPKESSAGFAEIFFDQARASLPQERYIENEQVNGK